MVNIVLGTNIDTAIVASPTLRVIQCQNIGHGIRAAVVTHRLSTALGVHAVSGAGDFGILFSPVTGALLCLLRVCGVLTALASGNLLLIHALIGAAMFEVSISAGVIALAVVFASASRQIRAHFLKDSLAIGIVIGAIARFALRLVPVSFVALVKAKFREGFLDFAAGAAFSRGRGSIGAHGSYTFHVTPPAVDAARWQSVVVNSFYHRRGTYA